MYKRNKLLFRRTPPCFNIICIKLFLSQTNIYKLQEQQLSRTPFNNCWWKVPTLQLQSTLLTFKISVGAEVLKRAPGDLMFKNINIQIQIQHTHTHQFNKPELFAIFRSSLFSRPSDDESIPPSAKHCPLWPSLQKRTSASLMSGRQEHCEPPDLP